MRERDPQRLSASVSARNTQRILEALSMTARKWDPSLCFSGALAALVCVLCSCRGPGTEKESTEGGEATIERLRFDWVPNADVDPSHKPEMEQAGYLDE